MEFCHGSLSKLASTAYMATDLGLINALQRDFKDTVRSWEWCRDTKKKIIILEQTAFAMQLLFEFTDELE